MDKIGYKSVDQYIKSFSEEEQLVLEKIRAVIKKTIPKAEEVISYQMPAYKQNGILVYFAAFSKHYSLFIPPMGVYEAFKKELEPYKISKATLQFQKSEPIPYELIGKLVRCAAELNQQRVTEKQR